MVAYLRLQREHFETPFLERIYNERPELIDQPYEIPKQGNNGFVILIGDEAFKAPFYRGVDDEWEHTEFFKEVHVLETLKDKIDFPIPEITFIAEDKAFYAMKRLPGITPTVDMVNSLSPSEEQSAAKDFARFIHQLSSAGQEVSIDCIDLPISASPHDAEALVSREDIQEVLGRPLFQTLSALLMEYNGAHGFLALSPNILSHSDLWMNNILIDPTTKKVTGVVDFGSLRMRPADLEFLFLAECYSLSFAQKAAEHYQILTGKPVHIYAAALYTVFRNVSFLADHIDREQPDHVPARIQQIEILLNRFFDENVVHEYHMQMVGGDGLEPPTLSV